MSNLAEKMKGFLDKKKLEDKIDVYDVSGFSEALCSFETADIRNLAAKGLAIAPLQFWVMPAAMRKNVHHESEHGIGEVVKDETGTNKVVSIGGKAYHTLRVLKVAEIFMEADDPAVKDWSGKVKKMKPGNEMTIRERDIIRLSCLWHDIFSGGTEDEFNPKRRSMDKSHPFYHRTEFKDLSNMVSSDEWDLILLAIENHMWKWSEADIVKYHAIKDMEREEIYSYLDKYRVVRIVELSDLIASRNF